MIYLRAISQRAEAATRAGFAGYIATGMLPAIALFLVGCHLGTPTEELSARFRRV